MSSTNVIELQKISKHYGAITAVDEINLMIGEGESLGLIGHNGAGKSTLFKIVLGLIQPSSGELYWHGQRADEKYLRRARESVGYLPENLALFDNLTGQETLQFFARFKPAGREQIADLLDEVNLTHAAQRRVATYSKGMRQRLGLAQALLGHPSLLFLDEPTNGLDPEGVRDLYAAVERRRRTGCTVIVTSHVLAEIEQRVQRLAIVKNGKLAAHGTLADLRNGQNLPVRMLFTFANEADTGAAHDVLATQFVLQRPDRTRLEVFCAPKQKWQVINTSQRLSPIDLHIREPRLEDLFFEVQS